MIGARDPERATFDRFYGTLSAEEREEYKQTFLGLPQEARDAVHMQEFGVPFYSRSAERTDVPRMGWSREFDEAGIRAVRNAPILGTLARLLGEGKAP
ncbi:MAG: hypothetical protein FJ290_14730 [Planctomycetes bacterium]|nr:hypothetical protein [Planctomycetota bacterium]